MPIVQHEEAALEPEVIESNPESVQLKKIAEYLTSSATAIAYGRQLSERRKEFLTAIITFARERKVIT